jgi:hypothetical protein
VTAPEYIEFHFWVDEEGREAADFLSWISRKTSGKD